MPRVTVATSPRLPRLVFLPQVGRLITILGLVVIGYVTIWRWWRVSTVHCWGNGQQLSAATCSVTNSLLGQPLLWLNPTTTRWSRLAVIQDDQQQWWYLTGWAKRLPGTVNLTYTQSQPAYQLTQDNQTWWLVNEAGLGQTIATPSAQLMVEVQPTWPSPPFTELRVDPKLHAWLRAVQIATQAQSEPLQKIVLIDQFTAELRWPNWTVVLTIDQDPTQQIHRLQQVQAALVEKNQTLGKDFRRVDLRFRLPVLQPQ